ncbi:cupin domain-containing protein [Pseudotabrizicola algicola]|uniref:Cupin domain-containing protein n=1 Tax=Pseudotabrizicola algicola TaxID=2709381 RepID=A0A6B3RI56_9RHOB|nr:cupin domain-containing protein [Pseudotabrizicola algicola]NEX45690.1 cupin domain-containing protein [Pseudotabrizicola algicola]
MPICHKLHPEGASAESYDGKQGFTYTAGISAQSVGSSGICMHMLAIPPGGRARAHKHATHETAIYMLEGVTVMYWGAALEHRMEVAAGEMLYIPADMPHLPFNPGPGTARAVIARTDPDEQESVVLLPHLEALVPA